MAALAAELDPATPIRGNSGTPRPLDRVCRDQGLTAPALAIPAAGCSVDACPYPRRSVAVVADGTAVATTAVA
jgi:hypothetical protein